MADINATTHSTLSLRESTTAVADLVTTCSGEITFSEQVAGAADILATSSEQLSFSEQTAGELTTTAVCRESLSFSEGTRAVLVVSATGAESIKFSEQTKTANTALSAESVTFSEISRIVNEISATLAESISFSDKAICILIETDDGVWAVNLATGGHSRYTGDLTGATPIDAYALTGVSELGSDRAKHVHEAFIHMRTSGEVTITTTTDEQHSPSPYTIPFDNREGMHRRRRKLAQGIKGTNWQFKIANVEGSTFTVKSLETPPIVSQRVR